MLGLVLSLSVFLGLGVAAIGAAEPDPSVEPVGVGQALPELGLTDQHERPGPIEAGTRLVLFAPDRESSELAHGVLEATGGETLEQAGVRYVADISAMPGLVTRMFALPKMRDYSYSMLLGREAADTAMLPRRDGELTLIGLEAGSVTDLSYVGTEAELRAALAPYLSP
ncbi:hypothetical protein CKO31_06510 [Thiohalocapsa halophila]|uniref:FAD/FMN-containing dehydrogenase n=1 Tax=Thiohalocapsa halophila TaxID=69359 RepID=A0ABS1CET0_9GAMM|nr:hypothetical protein [Thiohalocapsa halophila]MBK1630404.1 hypothetical protein [Thiohalocapsa halophila]